MVEASALARCAARAGRWALVVGLGATGCDGQLIGADADAGAARDEDAWRAPIDAGPIPDPGPTTYDLGELPDGLLVHWPAPPTITSDVRVTSATELGGALTARTRVTLATSASLVEITASDVELVVEDGVRVDELRIARQVSRVRVRGGSYGMISIEIPGTYFPSEEWHPEWRTTDVLIDDVDVESSDTAFLLRGGVRIAVTNSRAHAVRYGVWVGDTADFGSEDVIIAGNRIVADGPEATVRLVHVERSAVVGNRLENTEKHNYRIHGRSADNWAARNLLIGTGIMLGTLPSDERAIPRQWVDDNTFHHDVPSLLELDPRLAGLTMRDNHVYTDVWDCFVCVEVQPSWVLERNVVEAYRAPPP